MSKATGNQVHLQRLRRWARACNFTIKRSDGSDRWWIVDNLSNGIIGGRKSSELGGFSLSEVETVLARRLKAKGAMGKRQRHLT